MSPWRLAEALIYRLSFGKVRDLLLGFQGQVEPNTAAQMNGGISIKAQDQYF